MSDTKFGGVNIAIEREKYIVQHSEQDRSTLNGELGRKPGMRKRETLARLYLI